MAVIEHTGMSCPVEPNAVVQYWLGDGNAYLDRAGDLAWDIERVEEGRIVKYEVVGTRPVEGAAA